MVESKEQNDASLEGEKKETKKLDELKETPENKEAVAKSEGKIAEKKKAVSKPAVIKTKKTKKVEPKVEIEREYIVPLRRGFLKAPQYRRAKKAIRVLKEFMVRHMAVRDRDLRKVKIDKFLNNEIWFRGIKKPMNKVKVLAKKIDGIVYVELADVPDAVRYKMEWEKKRAAVAEGGKTEAKAEKKTEVVDADKDGVEDKVEEKEDVKAGAESDVKSAKIEAKAEQHVATGKHAQKTTPVRKVLK